jgi:hypothetical protein
MKKKPEKFSREWFVEQGKLGGAKGGNRTKELYGLQHFSKMGKKKVDNSKRKMEKVKIDQ